MVRIIWQSLQTIKMWMTITWPTDCGQHWGWKRIQIPTVVPAVRIRDSAAPLTVHPKDPSEVGDELARLNRGNPYLLDDSLLMMALTGRIEFRSFLCCSIRHDSANWAFMASNLKFSWTARATLFLSNGSSTQMYLFLHSWKLVFGKVLASRTEITCLSQLKPVA